MSWQIGIYAGTRRVALPELNSVKGIWPRQAGPGRGRARVGDLRSRERL